MNDLDLHLTVLFGWLVRTVGRALLLGGAAGGVLAVVAIWQDERNIGLLGVGLAALVTAFVLAIARPPLPADAEQHDEAPSP